MNTVPAKDKSLKAMPKSVNRCKDAKQYALRFVGKQILVQLSQNGNMRDI